MERCIAGDAGGIISLAKLITEHGRALNYDLMTRVGSSLYSVPEKLNWADLRDFVTYLDAGSALASEVSPENAGWQGDEKVPMLLAHIADLLANFSYGYAITHMKKTAQRPKPPQPIPRPGVAEPKSSTKKFGEGAIPISEFDEWWNTH